MLEYIRTRTVISTNQIDLKRNDHSNWIGDDLSCRYFVLNKGWCGSVHFFIIDS